MTDPSTAKPTLGRESGSKTRQNVDLAAGVGRVPAQTTVVGSDAHYPEEAPAHAVSVEEFWVQRHTVTNTQFAEFVDATAYGPAAERPLSSADYPGAPPENLQPGSMVFTRTQGPVDLRHLSQWWSW